MTQHIALLGDSIFDNAAYTRGEPDVVTHLRTMLPEPWRATLLAVDGATTQGLPAQLERLDASVSHLVISVGGNDALGNIDMLNARAASTGAALDLFETRIRKFERDYRAAIDRARRLALPTTLCTIYNGNLVDAREAHRARMALMMFNDVITRTAVEHGFNAIELRMVCTEASDYANPIEPSGPGGRKIARVIASAVGAGSSGAQCQIFH